MKKLMPLLVIFTTICATTVSAQAGSDPAAMIQRIKERIKPGLMEKAGISEEQADKVIDIHFGNQRKKRALRMEQDLSDEDKAKKNNEIDEAQAKEYKAIPLTDDQVKEVNAFFDEYPKERDDRKKSRG